MPNVSIQLPMIEADQSIEVTVTINGKKKQFNYRIEIFPWSECCDTRDKAECLKQVIKKYDQQWQLIQISEASQKDVTLMFKQVGSSPDHVDVAPGTNSVIL
ncbi:hypothetical protein JXO59_15050 [candidate division KSB1 bacterium]|nr:hypothetical protein [candidate division KSB1 bacterium]